MTTTRPVVKADSMPYDLDIRVVEMKTNDIKKALQTGEIDAGIVASLAGIFCLIIAIRDYFV